MNLFLKLVAFIAPKTVQRWEQNRWDIQWANDQILDAEKSRLSIDHWEQGLADEHQHKADELAHTRGEKHPSVIYLRERAQYWQNQVEIKLQRTQQRISYNRRIITEGGIF